MPGVSSFFVPCRIYMKQESSKARGCNMKEKLIKQIIMVLLLAAALFLADHSHIGVLERGSSVIQSQMAAEYTWSDVKHAGQKAAAANKLQQLLAEPQEEDDYEMFDFEKDENDPEYRKVTVSYDGNTFVLQGKQLLKIFNSTNFTDFGSLRYLYKYIEKSGAIDEMKEMGIEDGDIIKIEDFEFEYYDEDYFED